MDVQADKPMSVHELYGAIARFIDERCHSRDLDERWLADALKQCLVLINELRNSRIGPENRAKINAFRAAEIEDELEKKRRDIDVLERDLKKIKAA